MAEQNKISNRVIALMAFAPWILYGFASGFNHWRIAAGGGLVLCLGFLAITMRRGASIKVPDWSMLAFFVIASVMIIGLRSTAFTVYSAVVVWMCFALAAWGSVAIGRPFTAAYARETAPPEFWEHPIFIRLNLLMTLVWCGLDDRQHRFRGYRCDSRRQPVQAATELRAADGVVGRWIRIQQSLPGQIPCAVGRSNAGGKRASRVAPYRTASWRRNNRLRGGRQG